MKGKRINIRKALANSHLRREMMIPAIQAIQAREGIDTTREQAERAYDTVQAENGGAMEIKLCEKCGVEEAQDPHPCPYHRDINQSEDEEYCTCCVYCERDCRLSI